MLELTDANFESELQTGKFLLMFYTDWCPLCPPIIAMLSDLETEEHGGFTFAKIEFHGNHGAVQYYSAYQIPLVYALTDGKPLYGVAGLLAPEGYRMIVHEFLYAFGEQADNGALKEKIEAFHAFVDTLPGKGRVLPEKYPLDND